MVGRIEEIDIMKGLLSNKEAELLAVVGRRRVGKTYLIREVYKKEMTFEFVGVLEGTQKEQIQNFVFELKQTFGKDVVSNPVKTWFEGFQLLTAILKNLKTKKKLVLFFDEFPWLAGKKPNFLKAFTYFWNTWASNNNILIIICGSATAWITKNVINNKGGLHNRVTRTIYLQPFTCLETMQYLQTRNIKYDYTQVTELYMLLGGIPFYLKLVPKGKSIAQVIDELFFRDNAPLKNEFDNLYKALFNPAENHVSVIKACYSKWKGVSQAEIIQLSGIPSGGTLSKVLNELESSGFLKAKRPFTHTKKETLYRLTDEFSIFYLKYIDGTKNSSFAQISQSQSFKSWQGFAFENFCFKHIDKIKTKLGIIGIRSEDYSFYIKSTNDHNGSQIDLVIDRTDNCINICEIKFLNTPLILDKHYSKLLKDRIDSFRIKTKTRKNIFLTFISKSGLNAANNSGHLIDNEVRLQDFYK